MNATVDSYKNFIQRIGIKTVRQGKNLLIIWENLHPSKKQKTKMRLVMSLDHRFNWNLL